MGMSQQENRACDSHWAAKTAPEDGDILRLPTARTRCSHRHATGGEDEKNVRGGLKRGPRGILETRPHLEVVGRNASNPDGPQSIPIADGLRALNLQLIAKVAVLVAAIPPPGHRDPLARRPWVRFTCTHYLAYP